MAACCSPGAAERALDALRQATTLTPGSVGRLVKHGLLAFYYGDPKEAADVLAKGARLGLNSRVFDLQGLVLLAAVQFDLADRRGLAQSLSAIVTARMPQQASPRLRRFERIINMLHSLLDRQVAEAVAVSRELIGEISRADFEFEAACNLLSALARLSKRELNLEGVDEDVARLARRFAVSKTTTELLVRASFGMATFEDIIRRAYATICDQAEEAVSRTIGGAPSEAVH